MRKLKAKRDAFWQVGTLPFVALWAGSYAIAWGVVLFLFQNVEATRSLSTTQANVLGISTVLLVAGLLHVQVVERLLKHSMRGWMLYTLIGTVITFFTFSIQKGGAMWPTTLTVMSLLLPAPLIQTGWLWRRVKSAWLWPLASIVACLVFALPLRGSTPQIALLWAALLHGLIQGGVMRYLWTHTKNIKSSRIDFATDEADEGRLQRLQQNEAVLTTSLSEERDVQRHTL
jgi:hypothetical protein